MNTLEDRLKAALTETAAEIAPDGVPPLRLPVRPGRWAWARSWAWLAAPVTAAAAVTGVTVLSVILAQQGAPGRPLQTRVGNGPAPVLPPRYAAIAYPSRDSLESKLVIRSTATGRTLATVAPPRPANSFCALSGTPDGRTFVAQVCTVTAKKFSADSGGVGTMPGKFYKVTVGKRGKVTGLRPLPIPLGGPDELQSLSVSPDGSKAAVASVHFNRYARDPAIRLYSLATGQLLRSWTWAGKADIGGRLMSPGTGVSPVSWTADGRTIAFLLTLREDLPSQVRLLDTTAAGSSLRASRLVLSFTGTRVAEAFPFLEGPDVIITPDGSRIVATTATPISHPARTRLALSEFSAGTGAPIAVLNPLTVAGNDDFLRPPLWSSPDGSTLITIGVPAGRSVGRVLPLGVVTGGRFTPLPGRMAGITQIAF